MRGLCGLMAMVAGCAVPPLTIEGKLCAADDPCPDPYDCVTLESGPSICTTGCPPASSCAPTEGRACSSAAPCPSPYGCVRVGPDTSVCTACPPGVDFQPFELNCTDVVDNDCDGRPGSSRDVVLIEAPAEQPSWAWGGDGGYAAVYVRPQATGAALRFQRFDPSLAPVGAPVSISEGLAQDPLLVALPGRTWAVVWLDKSDGGTRVMFSKVDAEGKPLAAPRALGTAASIRGRPRASWGADVGSMLVLWVEGPNDAAISVSLLADGTVLRARSPFPRSGGALTGVAQVDVTDRAATNYDAGFAATWVEAGDTLAPRFQYVDREADPLTTKIAISGVNERANPRAANTLLSGFQRSFFVWTEHSPGTGQSTINGKSSTLGSGRFVLKGSTAAANVYTDLELAISTDDLLSYMDVAALTTDGSARVIISKLQRGDDAPTESTTQVQLKADARAPVIAIGGGRHAFAYQVDAGTSGRQIRAQLHCNPR